jgi:hypothetical protein
MNLRSVLPSLVAIFLPEAIAYMIIYFSFTLSFYLSVEILIIFLAGLIFFGYLGIFAFLRLYSSLRLTYRTAGYFDCFLREGLPCMADTSLLGMHKLFE